MNMHLSRVGNPRHAKTSDRLIPSFSRQIKIAVSFANILQHDEKPVTLAKIPSTNPNPPLNP